MLFEALCIEDVPFLHALLREHCLVSIYDQLFTLILAARLLDHNFELSLALLCHLLADVLLLLLDVYASHAC